MSIPAHGIVGQSRGHARHTVAIIVSLLLHLLLLLLFARFAFLNHSPITLQTSLAQEEELEIPAALKPRASNFGTTVFFDNRQASPTQASDQDQVQEEQKTLDTVDLREFALQNLLATQAEQPKQQAQEEQAMPGPQNILQATAGFLENLKQKGNDEFERDGDESKFPSLEEIKYLGYVKRVLWSLQKAWKINFSGKPVPDGVTSAGLAIDTTGKLVEIKVLQPSTNAMVNNLVQQHIRAATFPPVPAHFGEEVFRMAITFHYEGTSVGGIRFA